MARAVVMVLLSTFAVVSVSGCTSSGCGEGRGTAEELVADYLSAAQAASEVEDVCAFVTARNEDAAVELAQRLAPAIEDAGGAEELEVAVDPGRRMGSTHTVVVSARGEVVAELVVEDDDGTFRLLPDMNAP